MSIQIAIRHTTEYVFDRPVSIAPHVIRLRPAPHCRTPILSYNLTIEPEGHFINWQQDAFGNYLARLTFPDKASYLKVDVNLIADMTVINPFDFFLEPECEQIPFRYSKEVAKELSPYFERVECGKEFHQILNSIDLKPRGTVDFLVDLNLKVMQAVDYVIRLEPGVQSPDETLQSGKGSCRDSAWLLVQLLRHLGYAARFASGYLVQLTADVKSLDGPSGPTADFTDLHAWTEVFIPGAGWVGLDPTSGLFAGEGHIPLACTPSPSSAAPISGATEPCKVKFSYSNQVTRYRETPRTTKPYTDTEWQKILELGRLVDAHLESGDVRLTMGGEPTFISMDNRDAPEWNIQALGQEKREKAELLLRRLQQRFAAKGLLQYSQGKWYPGEQLPRWALNCYWRVDGEALWSHPELLARPDQRGEADAVKSQKFLQALARELKLVTTTIEPGYEDAFYYLWKEGTLPENVTPSESQLRDPVERARIRKLFETGLDRVVGYLLPLAHGATSWETSQWCFRREQMFLLPGDSPMGLRLPLDSLPWERKPNPLIPEDPFAHRTQLLKPNEWRDPVNLGSDDDSTWDDFEKQVGLKTQHASPSTSSEPVRTALCAEPRNGVLHLFLPPLTKLEHYIDLIAAIERVAVRLKTPLVIEGYEPPRDPRLQKLSVTPDPGVIEVNIHPAKSWEEVVAHTSALYEEAHQCRLATEKFNLDGRHTGTGGGNHVTLGGATAADSPLLRKPSLLKSLITYWQNHPSLSYLFSGQFIGPTSQAPRVDEARDETLFDLAIALEQIPEGDVVQPWLIDRILRNLLIDVSGNTHRAEFCIDKLYSPDSATGRLGLLEFRGFEMPPHYQMSLVQQLLLRSLIARFWEQPYDGKLVHWGTHLHDRFMLPHFVESDIREVAADLNRWGYAFNPEWFAPFLEFRFPQYGIVQLDNVEMELRFAIEPWNVLGEEVTSQGTSRFVDSSVERLQVKVKGMIPGRHKVLCNGRQVPLHPTGRADEAVAGIRYKAWNPPSGLHPTIAVHTPLVFDLVDTWSGLSLGGCTYHVSHPGGRNFDTLPVNGYEAEARRRARFWNYGHTPGETEAPSETPHRAHPLTLDLRYSGKS